MIEEVDEGFFDEIEKIENEHQQKTLIQNETGKAPRSRSNFVNNGTTLPPMHPDPVPATNNQQPITTFFQVNSAPKAPLQRHSVGNKLNFSPAYQNSCFYLQHLCIIS
eukprot:GCRY01006381.1.p1 GENE.GCRY01006381.1~~GCRY01006381.1.p1  ORF type:complete len:108 (+),score=5.76 GCRY01006381.1:188-511(+)